MFLSLIACLTNPATGRGQLSLLGESSEIQLGAEQDAQTTAAVPPVDDAALQAYVSEVGAKLAAVSERPGLPWTFRVLDDPAVNAFALPGGYLHLTRGLLAWLNSEDELAAVLGHEIGHVTARHASNSVSRAVLAAPLTGLAQLLDPDLEHVGLVVGVGAGLTRLSHSREQERQADDLALRYVQRAGYDPHALQDVFAALEAADEDTEATRLPGWLSTHPSPADRSARLDAALSALPAIPRQRAAYIEHLDGLVFGPDPRQGYFSGDRFHHPSMAFRLDLPTGWHHDNQHTALISTAPEGDVQLTLTLSDADSPEAAIEQFLSPEPIHPGAAWDGPLAGQRFRVQFVGRDGATRALDGLVAAVQQGDALLLLVGWGSLEGWAARGEVVAAAMASFSEEQDPAVLAVEPLRLSVITLPAPISAARLLTAQPSAISAAAVARLNGVSDTLPADRPIKLVVGSLPP